MENRGGAVNRIRPVAFISEGPRGQIQICVDERLRRRVVVKRVAWESFPDAETRNRLVDEARALSRIDHPNILRIYNYDERDNHDVFTIELAEGPRLTEALAEGIPFAKKVQIAMAVASALVIAHRNEVVHGALSPDSVTLCTKGEIKIVDFESTSTNVDGPRVAERWRSPEEARGEEATRESDMYRLGLLLLEMFGSRDRDVRALVGALLHEAPADRLTASVALDRLQRLEARGARRLRGASLFLLCALFALGVVRYEYDLDRERAAAVAANAGAEAARARANALVAFMIEDLRPKLLSVGKLEIMDATSKKAFAYFESMDPAQISAAEAAVNVRALAQFCEAQLLRNDVPAAESAGRKAVMLADATLTKYPNDNELLFARAKAHEEYAWALIRKGDFGQAFIHANAFATTCAVLVRRKPDDVRFLNNQAVAFGFLGLLYDSTGDIEASFRNYDTSFTMLNRVLQRAESEEARREFLNVGRFCGTALIKLGRFEEARRRMEAARANVESVLDRDGSNKGLLDLRAGYDDQLAALALATGDLDAARRHADAQLTTSQQLTAYDPAHFRWIRLLVMAHRTLGTIARMNGDLDTALRQHTAAIETASAVLAHQSAQNTLPRENANNHIELARTLLAMRSPLQALLHADLAVDTLRTMPADDSTAQMLLVDALYVRGEALAADGEQAAANLAWEDTLRNIDALRTRPADPRTTDTKVRALLQLDRRDRAAPLIGRLAALGYRNREFEALCREKARPISNQKGDIGEQFQRRDAP